MTGGPIFKYLLLCIYVIEFSLLAISPYDRTTWWAENIPMLAIVLTLVFTIKKFEFSPASYFAMFILIFLHTIGGHYTFERVPFSYVTELLGFERNNFDRFAHFSVGFYAFPICEFIDRKKLSNSKSLTAFFATTVIFTVAALYEIIEWLYADLSDPAAGAAFLGSQGDIWDAQKDMLADGSGAILAVIIYGLLRWRKAKHSS